ncbi:hypothetical protein R6Q59_031914 [Mikania micrantha]
MVRMGLNPGSVAIMFLMASRYWIAMHLSSCAPLAKMLPSWVLNAEKGGWNHLEGSAGTESRWELKRIDWSDGLEPGKVTSRRGLLGVVRCRVRVRRLGMDVAKALRKETADW